MQSSMPPEAEAVATLIGLAIAVLFMLAIMAISALIWCKIVAKTGYSWALGLLMLVPLANLILLLFLAFADWPVLRELRQLRPQSGRLPA